MRILTTAAQVRRVAGIEGGSGHYPDYPYGDVIPAEVGQALLDGLCDVAWPADRDFLNDDGGWIVIFDVADEFEQRPFGLPAVTRMEDIQRIACRNGETWWHCFALANNETSIDYAFKELVAPPAVLAQLMEEYELLEEG
jgi:hypothetical protein